MRVFRVILLVFFVFLGFLSLSILAIIRFTPEESADHAITVWFETSKEAVRFVDHMQQDGWTVTKGLDKIPLEEPNGYKVIYQASSKDTAQGMKNALAGRGLNPLKLDGDTIVRYKGVYQSRNEAKIDKKLLFEKYSVAFEVVPSYKTVERDAYKVKVSELKTRELTDVKTVLSGYSPWDTEVE